MLARAALARAAALQKLEEMQVKDTLRMINNMVELCFSECVSGFRQKTLTSVEEKCVCTCAEKFLKHSGRVGQRFGELWMAEQQAQQAAAEQGGFAAVGAMRADREEQRNRLAWLSALLQTLGRLHEVESTAALDRSAGKILTEILDDFRRFVDEVWRF